MVAQKRKRVSTRHNWVRMAGKLALKSGLKLAHKAVGRRLTGAAKRHKSSRSRSTQTQNGGGGSGPIESGGGGATNSIFKKLVKGPKRAKTRPFNTNIHKFTNANLTLGNQAKSAAYFQPYWEYTTVNSFVNTLFNQNPTTLDPTGTTFNVNQIRPYFMSCLGTFRFNNFTNGNISMTIYDIHCKTSTGDSPIKLWDDGDRAEEADAAAVGGNNFVIGSKPTDSKRFKQYWKVDKVTSVIMKPGEEHEHKIVHAPNTAQFQNNYLQSIQSGTGAYQYIGRLTRGVMWVITGQAFVDRGVGGTGGVSTTAAETANVWDLHYKYSMLQNPSTVITTSNALTAGSGTAPTLINEDTGVSAVAIQA